MDRNRDRTPRRGRHEAIFRALRRRLSYNEQVHSLAGAVWVDYEVTADDEWTRLDERLDQRSAAVRHNMVSILSQAHYISDHNRLQK
jgi:hypothetical protein